METTSKNFENQAINALHSAEKLKKMSFSELENYLENYKKYIYMLGEFISGKKFGEEFFGEVLDVELSNQKLDEATQQMELIGAEIDRREKDFSQSGFSREEQQKIIEIWNPELAKYLLPKEKAKDLSTDELLLCQNNFVNYSQSLKRESMTVLDGEIIKNQLDIFRAEFARRENRDKKAKSESHLKAMKTWKLVSGIISIVLSPVAALTTMASFFAISFSNIFSPGNGGSAVGSLGGFWVADAMLIGGIVSIATRKAKNNAGNIAIIILFGIGSIMSLVSDGILGDLVIWAIWCLGCALAASICVMQVREVKMAGRKGQTVVSSPYDILWGVLVCLAGIGVLLVKSWWGCAIFIAGIIWLGIVHWKS